MTLAYRALCIVVLVVILSMAPPPPDTTLSTITPLTESSLVSSVGLPNSITQQKVERKKNDIQMTSFRQQAKQPQQQTTKASCQELVDDYRQSMQNRTEGASVMVKRLQVLGGGCGAQLGDSEYFWNLPPNEFSTGTIAATLGDRPQQLVHLYYDKITPDVSFVVASALAAKDDWRNLQVLLWLPPPIYKEWTEVAPPPHWVDCPNHVTVLEYNMTEQVSDTVLKDRVAAGLPRELAYDPAYTTDAVRLILLYKYGGLWVDVDSMFVLDYNDMFDIEFAGYTYVTVLSMNGAMMRFDRKGDAITAMINMAAEQDLYGPFDGFKGLKRPFWKGYNKGRKRKKRVQVMATEIFEVPECWEGLECGFRKDCRFFQDVRIVNDDYPVPWYESRYFNVKDNTQRIVHTHNECPKHNRTYHEHSMFQILLDMYLAAIQKYPYCRSRI